MRIDFERKNMRFPNEVKKEFMLIAETMMCPNEDKMRIDFDSKRMMFLNEDKMKIKCKNHWY